MIKWLGAIEVERVVFEATGAYHRLFERTLAEARLPVVKTDQCGAAMLARMGSALALEPTPVVSQSIDEMKELLKARDALIKDRVAALNRQKTVVSPLLNRQLTHRLRQIDAQIEAIDKHQEKLRNANSQVSERFKILTSIPSFGDATADAILVVVPELGHIEQAEAASLVGLAPIANDSGKSRGRRSIRGGRARARQALYMPALCAIQFNPDCKAKYHALIKAGKPAKVALVAIMRKLLVLASQTRSCATNENGRQNPLDQHGYLNGSVCRDAILLQSLVSAALPNR